MNATLSTATGTGTIVDNDPTPSLSINSVSVQEGDSGTRNATLTVSLSAASGKQVTVNYATANGTATAGSDYTAASGTLTFQPGTTTQTINVPVIGDTASEGNETVLVNLSNPTNATIATGQGVVTIVTDDPKLSINNVSVTEGDSGSVNAVFTVTLSQATSQTVSVNYTTANGTAASGSDYTSTSGVLTIPANATSGTISVPVLGDLLNENNETFTVTISNPVNAAITTAVGTAHDRGQRWRCRLSPSTTPASSRVTTATRI